MLISHLVARWLKPSAYGILSSVCLLGLVACGGGGGGGGGSNPPASSTAASSTPSSTSDVSSSLVSSSAASSVITTMIHADGTKWVKPDGTKIILKGTNIGNWLVQEFWMMGQGGNGVVDQCTLENTLTTRFTYAEKERLMKVFHDSWFTTRDWDQIQALGFNVVRLPILWSVIEDEKNFKTLRTDAWDYLDWAVSEAKKRGIYVIMDLHGAAGGQTSNDHTGCSGQNKYWSVAENQERTKWFWQQIATHFKDEPTVAAYDPLNEPWGSTTEDMATRVTEIYNTIRAIDPDHLVLLPSFYGDIDSYGNPASKGMYNVAFEIHPYPGLFGDRPGDTPYMIHRDWLRCGEAGTGGVCFWNTKMTSLNTPLLIGEFQPWQSAGLDIGGQIARATYDTYASYNWASTSWAYKLVSAAGGQGKGTWGIVTNAIDPNSDKGVGLVAKASTWDCAGWDASFATACVAKATSIKVGGTGSKNYYFVIKTGALSGANPDVTYDKISIVNDSTQAELITNGNFGSNTGWTAVTISGSETLDFNYSAAGKTPTNSEGSVLRVTRPNGVTGEINGAIYQMVTLEGGQNYTLTGVFKDNGSADTWSEMYLVDAVPVQNVDIIDMTGKVDFTKATALEIENLFKSFATQEYDVHSGLAQWLTSSTPPDIFTLPPKPSNVQLVENANSVDLTWNASTDNRVTGYQVYRSTAAGTSGTLIADAITTNTYTDSTIVSGTTYYYTIIALTPTTMSYPSAAAHTALSYVSVPAQIEAEAFTSMSGIQMEDCSDTGAGKDVGYFDPDDFIEFKINVATAGNFAIDYRLATANGSTGFAVLIDDVQVDSHAVANTHGWQTWVTETSPTFAMTQGNHTLRFKSIGKEWNINWFSIKAK